jgi:hypothetical protein
MTVLVSQLSLVKSSKLDLIVFAEYILSNSFKRILALKIISSFSSVVYIAIVVSFDLTKI